jgi:hypothetical protein
VTKHTPENFSTPSNDEIALIAIMRADAAVLAERDKDRTEAIETARREKIRAARLGKKQSPQLIAKRVAGFKAARARRAQSRIQPVTVSPVRTRRQSHG